MACCPWFQVDPRKQLFSWHGEVDGWWRKRLHVLSVPCCCNTHQQQECGLSSLQKHYSSARWDSLQKEDEGGQWVARHRPKYLEGVQKEQVVMSRRKDLSSAPRGWIWELISLSRGRLTAFERNQRRIPGVYHSGRDTTELHCTYKARTHPPHYHAIRSHCEGLLKRFLLKTQKSDGLKRQRRRKCYFTTNVNN